MTLVIDASAAVAACFVPDGFDELAGEQLVSPALMWFEAHSVLHEMVWRQELDPDHGTAMRERLTACPVKRRGHPQLGAEAWRLAEEFGWAKTYDAHYVALAKLLGCRLVTVDARLRRGADRLGFVVAPSEL